MDYNGDLLTELTQKNIKLRDKYYNLKLQFKIYKKEQEAIIRHLKEKIENIESKEKQV